MLILCYLKVDTKQLERQLSERAQTTNETYTHQQARLRDEDEQFTKFEERLQSGTFPENVLVL